MRSFADIPGEVARAVRRGERVLLILLDALGKSFLEGHGDHPLVQRLDVEPLRSQFPSTTTAHVSTMHFGLPVEQHGLYEWNVLEPSLGAIICPLRFSYAGSDAPGDLAPGLDPRALWPGPTGYESLDGPAAVFQPREIADSPFTRLACRGATVSGFRGLAAGVADAVAHLSTLSGGAYAFVYWDRIDRAGHESGASSPEFHAAARAALDAAWGVLAARGADLTVLFTADHGQVDVSPDRVDYLDDLWPQLGALLAHPRPAGSSRDAFLHVVDGAVDTVIAELSARLGARADVRRAADLFGDIGPRLRDRLGDVAVLPVRGRQVWLRGAAANETWFRGQHGGLDPAETETYLARLVR